jgi:pyruvate kinase
VVIAAGSPPGQAGSTNTVKVHRIGDLADSGGLVQGHERPARERVGVWPARSPL